MKTNLLGLIEGLSNDDYHKGQGYSASDLITMSDGFDEWKRQKTHPEPPTDDLVVGQATHLLLEARLTKNPDLFYSAVKVKPVMELHKGALSTVEDLKEKCKSLGLPVGGKKGELIERVREADPTAIIWDDILKTFTESSTGKMILSSEDHALVHRMVDAVFECDLAMGYLDGGISEPSVYVKDETTGLLLKCRPDRLRASDGLSINFKTMRPGVSFERQAADRAYDWASSFYCYVLGQHFNRSFDEIHISVIKETDPTKKCRVLVDYIADDDLQFARNEWTPILPLIVECEKTGIWPAPPVRMKEAKIPPFFRRLNPYVRD